jgi:hypothetical protein
MPHMVVFRTNEGKQAYHPTEALEDAIRFVEHLRNAEQVTDAHVFRMQEVPLEFKVLYKVEVGTGSAADEPAAPAPAGNSTAARASDADEVFTRGGTGNSTSAGDDGRNTAPRAEVVADNPQSGGRFGLFSRS